MDKTGTIFGKKQDIWNISRTNRFKEEKTNGNRILTDLYQS